eukprot:gene14568-biopygen180
MKEHPLKWAKPPKVQSGALRSISSAWRFCIWPLSINALTRTHLFFIRSERSSSPRMRCLFPKAAGGWAAPRCAGGAARVQLRSAFRNLRSAFRNPRSAFRSCVLRSAAFCVQLRSEACVRLRSRSAAFCVRLRSANIGAIVRHDESSVCHRAP